MLGPFYFNKDSLIIKGLITIANFFFNFICIREKSFIDLFSGKETYMKASELRFGNLLLFSNKITPDQIITVGRRFFSSASIEKEDGDFEITPYYKPILLTEEWLLKFGFKELRDGIYQFWGKDVGIFQVMICSDNNGFGIRIWTTGTLGRTIYYVHDFQNLYFALTGEELKLKTLL